MVHVETQQPCTPYPFSESSSSCQTNKVQDSAFSRQSGRGMVDTNFNPHGCTRQRARMGARGDRLGQMAVCSENYPRAPPSNQSIGHGNRGPNPSERQNTGRREVAACASACAGLRCGPAPACSGLHRPAPPAPCLRRACAAPASRLPRACPAPAPRLPRASTCPRQE